MFANASDCPCKHGDGGYCGQKPLGKKRSEYLIYMVVFDAARSFVLFDATKIAQTTNPLI